MGEFPLALVAGAGPGLGSTLLKHFDDAGFRSFGLVRSAAQTEQLRTCDLTEPEAVSHTVASLIEQYGAPSLVVHNTADLVINPLMNIPAERFESCWRNMVLSAFNLAQAVMDPMARAGSGTFIVTGATASLRGGAGFSAFASAKFALRGLTQSLAREYQPAGIHVAHVVMDGIIDTPASRKLHSLDPDLMMNASDIARVYLDLANQPRSTWSHEIDLRSQSERF